VALRNASIKGESRGRQDRAISPSRFGGSDEAVHYWMPVIVAQANNGAPGWVIGILQDLIAWYLDALPLGLDPEEAGSVRLVIGGLTISLKRATEGVGRINECFSAGHSKASEPIGELVSWLMSRRTRRQQKNYGSQDETYNPTQTKRGVPANSGHGVQVIECT